VLPTKAELKAMALKKEKESERGKQRLVFEQNDKLGKKRPKPTEDIPDHDYEKSYKKKRE